MLDTNVTVTDPMGPRESHLLKVCHVCNLGAVTVTKALVFKWIFKRRPIKQMDYLIVVDELEKYFGFLYLSVNALIYSGKYNTLEKLQDMLWHVQDCWAKMLVVGLVAQMFGGGLGISIMRMLIFPISSFNIISFVFLQFPSGQGIYISRKDTLLRDKCCRKLL